MNFLQQSLPEPPPVVKPNGSIQVPVQVSSGVTSAIETITPETAKRYLENRNGRNRSLSKNAILKYADDMKNGRWNLTGQPIVFDSTGQLLDGHHRLTACADHKISFQTVVTRGVDPGSVVSFDLVRPRTASDIAHMAGTPNSTRVCAIVKLILIHERHGIEYMHASQKHPSRLEIAQSVKFYPGIQIAAARGRAVRSLIQPSCAGFCYWAFRQQDAIKADRFFEELESGANLSPFSPTLQLRNLLISNGKSKAKLNEMYLIALTFKAWVAFRDGRKVKNLKWQTGGATPEPFPTI